MSTQDEVLKPYKDIIDSFDANQKVQWAYWDGICPERVAEIRNETISIRAELKNLKGWSDKLVLIAVAVPIIVTFLTNTIGWPTLASLLDAISPAILVYIQNKIKKVNAKYQAYILVDNPLYRLMYDVILDIHKGTYQEKEMTRKDKYTELEKILHESELE